jgi:UDP-GlcNAc:undecaprenyl-phosphate GlcNAc-1-phosphate transferase
MTLARRLDFLDRPVGWKQHASPTPYLGGLAVLLGFGLAAVALADGTGTYAPIVVCAVALAVLGIADDRWNVGARYRVGAELASGAVLWAADLGWSVFSSDTLNLMLTALWVLAVINAFNLLDLMDGVATTVAATCATAIGILAVIHSAPVLAALAFALAGACLGFLPFNARSPARIFLGDGGSMPVGLVLAALTIGAVDTASVGGFDLLMGALLLGLPLLDMTFRIVSRIRRGVSLMTGGPDSLANLLRRRLSSAAAVGVSLGALQALSSAAAITGLGFGMDAALVIGVTALVVGAVAIVVLDVLLARVLSTPVLEDD